MKHLTPTQLDSLLAVIDNDQARLMVLVAFNHALRASEVVSLLPSNIRDGFLIVQRKKGSLKTIQPLLENEKAKLQELAASTNGRLFPICRQHFWRLVQKYGELAGLPAHVCHPHALKHTTAMTALNHGMKINELQRYLGHKSGASTMEYLRVTDDVASQAFAKALGGVNV